MFRRPPDLLFVPAHVLPVVLPARSVTTVHDVAFMERGRGYSPHGALYLRFAALHAARGADALITVSEFSKKEILAYLHADADDIAVTHLGFDAEKFGNASEQDIERVRAKYGFSEHYFLFVGRIESKKNIEGMLLAFAGFRERCTDAELVLVGKRGRGGEAAMRAFSGHEAARHVHELGYVDPDDLPALYAGAKALLFPSKYEGFGIPAIEAMASGTPVIASDTTSLPEVCGDAALYAHPDDTAAISAAMCRIMEESSLRAALILRGKERAKVFRWDETTRRTWDVLRNALENKK
jgi:glycosyltransferase involved in cell wall biosynthesis